MSARHPLKRRTKRAIARRDEVEAEPDVEPISDGAAAISISSKDDIVEVSKSSRSNMAGRRGKLSTFSSPKSSDVGHGVQSTMDFTSSGPESGTSRASRVRKCDASDHFDVESKEGVDAIMSNTLPKKSKFLPSKMDTDEDAFGSTDMGTGVSELNSATQVVLNNGSDDEEYKDSISGAAHTGSLPITPDHGRKGKGVVQPTSNEDIFSSTGVINPGAALKIYSVPDSNAGPAGSGLSGVFGAADDGVDPESFAAVVAATLGKDMHVPLAPGHDVMYNGTTFPEVCDVTFPSLQDELLLGTYDHLRKLTKTILHSWSPKEGPNQCNFKAWAWKCLKVNFPQAKALMLFESWNRYIYLARVDPVLLKSVAIGSGGVQFTLNMLDGNTAICLTPVETVDSHLLTPTEGGQKYVSGILHSQDYERFCAVLGMVFGHSAMHAQLFADALTFSTKSDKKYGVPSTNAYASFTSPKRRSVPSPATVCALPSSLSLSNMKNVLDVTDEVHILDARGVKFNLQGDLLKLHTLLHPFGMEIPQGSLAVVAHTVGVYSSKDDPSRWNLSLNVQWVMVLGTPP